MGSGNLSPPVFGETVFFRFCSVVFPELASGFGCSPGAGLGLGHMWLSLSLSWLHMVTLARGWVGLYWGVQTVGLGSPRCLSGRWSVGLGSPSWVWVATCELDFVRWFTGRLDWDAFGFGVDRV